MRRPRAAALVIAVLVVGAAAGTGAWWLHAHGQFPALSERLATLSGQHSPERASSPVAPSTNAVPSDVAATPAAKRNAPMTASRERPSSAAAMPSPPKPSLQPAPAARADANDPSFDIVRVEPRGDTVVAGKGAPNAKVALMAGNKVVGEATTDGSGQFVILPPPLAPGDYDLTLRQQAEGGKPPRASTQSVAVSVPKPGQGAVVVALAEPGKATKLLSAAPERSVAPTTDASGRPDKVAIRSAELENGTGLYVSGAARPGTPVHVYLNDSHLADIVASPDGAWSVRVKHGLTGGHYKVRADATGADGKVASRAEVPFDVPVLMAEAATPKASERSSKPGASATATTAPPHTAAVPPAAPAPKVVPPPQTIASNTSPTTATQATPDAALAPQPSPSPGADATIDTIATARVTRGDNLWNISRFRLGDGMRYTQIYSANSDQIRDPNLIYPGQVFVVPNR